MALTIYPNVSPRLIIVDSPAVAYSIQNLHDEIREWEDEPWNLSYKKIVKTEGKQLLDQAAGVRVGLTMELDNAIVGFEYRPGSFATGSATSASVDGTRLVDTGAQFETDGVMAGDTIENTTDLSYSTVIRVVSETELVMWSLLDGSDNQWEISDNYKLFHFVQCEIAGGNLTAVDDAGDPMSSILTTAQTQVLLAKASTATLQEQEALQYASFGGGVSIDVVNGQPGTQYPVGNKEFPVDNIPDAVTIAINKGFSVFYVINTLILDTGDSVGEYCLCGETAHRSTLVINPGALTDGVQVIDLSVSGTLDGDADFARCKVENLSNVSGHFHECMLVGTISLSGSEASQFVKCYDGLPGSGVPTIDCGGSGRDVGVWGWHGGLKLINKSGTEKISVNMDSGRLILDSTVSNGEILVKGVGLLQDDSTGTASVDDSGLVNPAAVLAAIVSASGVAIAGSTSTIVRTNLTQANNFYDDMYLQVVNSAGTAVRRIDNYANTNGAFSLNSALPFTPAADDQIFVLSTMSEIVGGFA
jgi:hypothetical protein